MQQQTDWVGNNNVLTCIQYFKLRVEECRFMEIFVI